MNRFPRLIYWYINSDPIFYNKRGDPIPADRLFSMPHKRTSTATSTNSAVFLGPAETGRRQGAGRLRAETSRPTTPMTARGYSGLGICPCLKSTRPPRRRALPRQLAGRGYIALAPCFGNGPWPLPVKSMTSPAS